MQINLLNCFRKAMKSGILGQKYSAYKILEGLQHVSVLHNVYNLYVYKCTRKSMVCQN